MRGIRMINPLGLIGGILAISIFLSSTFYGEFWWEMRIGEDIGHIKVSALNYEIELLGSFMEIKILWFIILVFRMLLIESAIALIICSIAPGKNFSDKLLNFAYLKPLLILLTFIVFLLILLLLLPLIAFRVSLPILGSSIIPIRLDSARIDALITSRFTNSFWIMIATTLTYLSAHIYHNKIIRHK
ncbi:hypothetical protein KEJ14_01885 [Candidatus Bathyarchaeota archaeon]|nr:hypothetical protein [Candidatus Bathyarchaeota archaeon]